MRTPEDGSGENLDMERGDERRNYRRLPVRAGAIAALNDSKLGTITDISRDGLAFRYIDFGYEDKRDDLASAEACIVTDAGFALHNVPCKIILDDSIQPEYPFSSIRTKKCRLQFAEMTPELRAQLNYFIANFAESQLDDEPFDLGGDYNHQNEETER